MKIDLSRWDAMYKSKETGWDIGYASPPFIEFFEGLKDTSVSILVPGGGNSYEVEYLFKRGFTNVEVVDISPTALANLRLRLPSFPEKQMHCLNFFELNRKYDVVLEQTFFCAIDRELRPAYVNKVYDLLKEDGFLVGLLWNKEKKIERPPYGGSMKEYKSLFTEKFDIQIMEECYNSIKPRMGHELFIKLNKKSNQL